MKRQDWIEAERLAREKILTREEICSVYKITMKKLQIGLKNIRYDLSHPDQTEPLGRKVNPQMIDEIIAEKFGFGMSTKLIAEKHGLHVQTVQKIIRENTKSPTAKTR